MPVCNKLSPEKPKMQALSREAARENLEYGAVIDKDWKLGEPVKGRPHEVQLPRGSGSLGGFHTHLAELAPSLPDLWTMLYHQDRAMCIGEARIAQPRVRCYSPAVDTNYRALGLAVKMMSEATLAYKKDLEARHGKAIAKTELDQLEGKRLLRQIQGVKEVVSRRWMEVIQSCPVE